MEIDLWDGCIFVTATAFKNAKAYERATESYLKAADAQKQVGSYPSVQHGARTARCTRHKHHVNSVPYILWSSKTCLWLFTVDYWWDCEKKCIWRCISDTLVKHTTDTWLPLQFLIKVNNVVWNILLKVFYVLTLPDWIVPIRWFLHPIEVLCNKQFATISTKIAFCCSKLWGCLCLL